MSHYTSQEDGTEVYGDGTYQVTVSITMKTVITVCKSPDDMEGIDDAVEEWAAENGIPDDVDMEWDISDVTEV